jgi:ATP synthase protein I
MSEDPPPDPLARLGAEIDEARRERRLQEPKRDAPPRGALAFGYRVAIELVAGLCVGLALGWGFDRLFGTRHHWGLIAGFFLGVAAGMLNVFRAAKEMVFGSDLRPPGGGGTRRG